MSHSTNLSNNFGTAQENSLTKLNDMLTESQNDFDKNNQYYDSFDDKQLFQQSSKDFLVDNYFTKSHSFADLTVRELSDVNKEKNNSNGRYKKSKKINNKKKYSNKNHKSHSDMASQFSSSSSASTATLVSGNMSSDLESVKTEELSDIFNQYCITAGKMCIY